MPCIEMQRMQKMFNTCTWHVVSGDWKITNIVRKATIPGKLQYRASKIKQCKKNHAMVNRRNRAKMHNYMMVVWKRTPCVGQTIVNINLEQSPENMLVPFWKSARLLSEKCLSALGNVLVYSRESVCPFSVECLSLPGKMLVRCRTSARPFSEKCSSPPGKVLVTLGKSSCQIFKKCPSMFVSVVS